MNEPPIQLKCMKPFISRGNDFENIDPITAFYCRQYAVELGMKQTSGNFFYLQ